MRLRIATLEDIDTIQALRLDMLNEVAQQVPQNLAAEIRKYLTVHIQDGSCLCVLLENEGVAIGKAMLCMYEVMPDEINTSGKCATLFSVYTIPEHRGRGYMEELLYYLLEQAKKAGVKEVFASAEQKAIPLYQRIGFTLKDHEMRIRL